MNDLTPAQREARMADARATLLRALEAVDDAIEEARQDAGERSPEGATLKGEPYVEAVLVLWSVRWPDAVIEPEKDVRVELAGGWTATTTPRTHLVGMMERLREFWRNEERATHEGDDG